MTVEEAVKEYQCTGCGKGPFEKCFSMDKWDAGCANHSPGTAIPFGGHIFLGLPKGFNRLGTHKSIQVCIYEDINQHKKNWTYNMFNVPIWMHLDENLNTLVRGLRPRLNLGFIHIFLCDVRDYVKAPYEITKSMIDEMD